MKIVFIINTDSLSFDERVRKEAITLESFGHKVSIVALEQDNIRRKGNTQYGTPFTSIMLVTRKIFKQAEHVIIKAIEMHLKFIYHLARTKWDILWVHEHSSAGILFFGWFIKVFDRKRLMVWNQHELAPDSWIHHKVYKWIYEQCDIVIHANQERAAYIKAKYPEVSEERLFYINNYPSEKYTFDIPQIIDQEFKLWNGGQSYCIFQGSAVMHRKIFECIEGVRSSLCPRLVIMGPCEKSIEKRIEKQWPDYKEWIYITGWIAPQLFNSYLDHATLSMVFYQNIDNNHWLAAPNRFYHAIIRNIPVLCGPNPTMKNIVDGYGVGVVCSKNADSISEITKGIDRIVANNTFYVQNCSQNKHKFQWESQLPVYNKMLIALNRKQRLVLSEQ